MNTNAQSAGQEIHRLSQEHATQYSCSYAEALRKVLAANPELRAAYLDLPEPALKAEPVTAAQAKKAGELLDEKTRYQLKYHGGDYSATFAQVCQAHRDLAAVYTGFAS